MVSVASPVLLLLVALASVGARDLYQVGQDAGADESNGSAPDGASENYEEPLAEGPSHGSGRQAGAISLGSILTALGTAGLGGLLTPLLGQTLGGLLGSSLGSGLGVLASSLGGGGAAARQPLTASSQDLSSLLAARLAQKPHTRPAHHHVVGNEDDEEEHTLHYEAYLVQVPGLGPCIVLAPQQQPSGGHYNEQALAMPLGPVSLKPFQPPHHQDFNDHDLDVNHQAAAPPLKKPAGALNGRIAASYLDDTDSYHR